MTRRALPDAHRAVGPPFPAQVRNRTLPATARASPAACPPPRASRRRSPSRPTPRRPRCAHNQPGPPVPAVRTLEQAAAPLTADDLAAGQAAPLVNYEAAPVKPNLPHMLTAAPGRRVVRQPCRTCSPRPPADRTATPANHDKSGIPDFVTLHDREDLIPAERSASNSSTNPSRKINSSGSVAAFVMGCAGWSWLPGGFVTVWRRPGAARGGGSEAQV